MDQIEKIPPLKSNDVQSVERFADLVRIAVVKLQAEGRGGELKDGALHSLLEEVRIRVEAVEMLNGIETETVGAAMDSGKQVDKGGRIRNIFSEGNRFGKEPAVPRSKPPCVYCGGDHGVWSCRRFQNMGVVERWNVARDKRLCSRCLASDHERRTRTKARPCNINGCERNHHHLLHGLVQGNPKDGRVVSPREGAPAHTRTSTSRQETATETFSLRTVPVWLKANDRKLKEVETFQSMPLDVTIESLDGEFSKDIKVKTCPKRVTGNYKVENWKQSKDRWPHLRECDFAEPEWTMQSCIIPKQITEHKLKKKCALGTEYSQIIQAYVEKGYLRRVEPDEPLPPEVWYLPHFPVIRMDKATTKIRIVFDCSAKTDGVSLNDAICAGPKLQKDLFDVLIRFRRNPIALACDIKEMYLQVEIEERDRPYFRLLWRDLDSSRKPDVYEFSRVVFGKNSAPMEPQFVAQENARRHQDEYPLAAETVLRSTYMVDSIDSVETVQDGT
ncbi:hypothetical protein AWC38_SpisGene16530 [Stylophora pistillata]|uniref:Peptidase aspartic putative domain-containing protein n=1 Tax=Stylophora pistillata TaxID=50429 RepID=A0A2B4RS82_STYPI|nr:hypothetical protein AWC38_SpisGene16530 [Stylophora pistillata]